MTMTWYPFLVYTITIVIYQIKYKNSKHSIIFNIDVFPGYNSQIIGPNPYYMYRETFNIKHISSIIPNDYDLKIPQLAIPIDFKLKKN